MGKFGASPSLENRFLLDIFSLGFGLPLRNGSREEVEGMGVSFPSNAAEHRHHTFPAAPPSTGLSQDAWESRF